MDYFYKLFNQVKQGGLCCRIISTAITDEAIIAHQCAL